MVSVEGLLYVCGGYNGNREATNPDGQLRCLVSVEQYSASTDQWTKLSAMTFGICFFEITSKPDLKRNNESTVFKWHKVYFYIIDFLSHLYIRIWFWRYSRRGLIRYLNQSSIRLSTYLFLIVKSLQTCSCAQPVLSIEGKVSCSREQWEPLMGLEFTTDRYPPITSQTRYLLRHAASPM